MLYLLVPFTSTLSFALSALISYLGVQETLFIIYETVKTVCSEEFAVFEPVFAVVVPAFAAFVKMYRLLL